MNNTMEKTRLLFRLQREKELIDRGVYPKKVLSNPQYRENYEKELNYKIAILKMELKK